MYYTPLPQYTVANEKMYILSGNRCLVVLNRFHSFDDSTKLNKITIPGLPA